MPEASPPLPGGRSAAFPNPGPGYKRRDDRKTHDPARRGRGVDHDAARRVARARGLRPRSPARPAEAIELGRRTKPDLVLLDLMLPDGSGLDVCRELRAASDVPIIMLTARGEEIDRVVGLELGATTTSSSRFSAREVIARIRAVLRRPPLCRRRERRPAGDRRPGPARPGEAERVRSTVGRSS